MINENALLVHSVHYQNYRNGEKHRASTHVPKLNVLVICTIEITTFET